MPRCRQWTAPTGGKYSVSPCDPTTTRARFSLRRATTPRYDAALRRRATTPRYDAALRRRAAACRRPQAEPLGLASGQTEERVHVAPVGQGDPAPLERTGALRVPQRM